MAPKRTKNAKNSDDSDTLTRPQVISTKSPARTPIQSPRKRLMGITTAQKQALIDNLQLEVTERARKLRAQYALQAQSLRTRVELRVNRIPSALRKANMGELFEKYMQTNELRGLSKEKVGAGPSGGQAKASQDLDERPETSSSTESLLAQRRGLKRDSDEMSVSGDKENAPGENALPNPKKRAKPNAASSKSYHIDSTTVLSPKSANARAIPRRQQQEKPLSGKSIMPPPSSPHKPLTNSSSRPTSPVKPLPSPYKTAANTAAATSLLSSMLSSDSHVTATAAAAGARTGTMRAKPGRPKINIANASDQAISAASTSTTTHARAPTKAAAAGRAKRAPMAAASRAAGTGAGQDVRKASNTSSMSTTSMGTTIVSKTSRGTRAGVAAGTKGRNVLTSKAGMTARKGGAGTGSVAEVEAMKSGRRVLRKR